MLFDRISLVEAFQALEKTELNEGKISEVLFNKTAYYGTKTQLRFKSVADLRDFINTNYPFQQIYFDCQCGTCNEEIWQLLSFTVELPNRRFISFINNLRGQFESAEGYLLNKTSKDALSAVFTKSTRLKSIHDGYECKEYIQNQGRYTAPCEYIEVEYNSLYLELIELYNKTKGIKGLETAELFVNDCYENVIETPKKWDDGGLAYPTTTTTTTAAPTTTTAAPAPQHFNWVVSTDAAAINRINPVLEDQSTEPTCWTNSNEQYWYYPLEAGQTYYWHVEPTLTTSRIQLQMQSGQPAYSYQQAQDNFQGYSGGTLCNNNAGPGNGFNVTQKWLEDVNGNYGPAGNEAANADPYFVTDHNDTISNYYKFTVPANAEATSEFAYIGLSGSYSWNGSGGVYYDTQFPFDNDEFSPVGFLVNFRILAPATTTTTAAPTTTTTTTAALTDDDYDPVSGEARFIAQIGTAPYFDLVDSTLASVTPPVTFGNLPSSNHAIIEVSDELQYMIATAFNGGSAVITYDRGVSWQSIPDVPQGTWEYIFISHSGQVMILNPSVNNMGDVWISTDYGASFSLSQVDLQVVYGAKASSGGKYIYITGRSIVNDPNKSYDPIIYRSADYGASFQDITSESIGLEDLAFTPGVSGNGQYVYLIGAIGAGTLPSYYSSDYGQTWTERTSLRANTGVEVDQTGQYLMAHSQYTPYGWYSNDYGATQISFNTSSQGRYWGMSNTGEYSFWQTISGTGSRDPYINTDNLATAPIQVAKPAGLSYVTALINMTTPV